MLIGLEEVEVGGTVISQETARRKQVSPATVIQVVSAPHSSEFLMAEVVA